MNAPYATEDLPSECPSYVQNSNRKAANGSEIGRTVSRYRTDY